MASGPGKGLKFGAGTAEELRQTILCLLEISRVGRTATMLSVIMGRARTRPLRNGARLSAMLRLLDAENLPIGRTLPARALVAAAVEGEGVGRARASAALAELFSLGLVARQGDLYSPTSAGAKALATELLSRDDRGEAYNMDLPHPGATVEEHRGHIARLLEAADELRNVERTREGESGV